MDKLPECKTCKGKRFSVYSQICHTCGGTGLNASAVIGFTAEPRTPFHGNYSKPITFENPTLVPKE